MEPEEFRERELDQKLDVMNILSHFIQSEEECGQGDGERNRAVSVTPSEYKAQLLMSTEDRLETLATAKAQFLYPSELDVTPKIVIFQQFLAKKKYNTTISIINIDTESHFVKILPENSSVFSIEFKGPILSTKVAPGLSHIYNVHFCPDEIQDYEYHLQISTDLGFFYVPIIALGPRPVLSFPDIISFPVTAVKIPSTVSLTVRNLGNAPAVFKLSSLSPQFSIEPSNGRLNPQQNRQFHFNFMTPSSGNFTGLLFLKYDTGELIRIRMQGSTTSCTISLTTNNLPMADTFLGLSTDKTIKIFNDSDYTLDYQWMKFQTLLKDNEERERFTEIFATAKDTETLRYTDLEYFDICNSEMHEKTCERIYNDEISFLTKESFLFSSKHISLSPTSGKVWPKSSSQVLLTFQPQDMGEIAVTAFLEISGSEQRIPLTISGICRGPEIKLNTSTIEIARIYLCSTQNIEIICSNVGFIPGTLVHREKPSDVGAVVRISPHSHKLNPNECRSFNLSFMTSRTGEFVERVDFVIEESSEVISVYIKGRSVCPSLHFDKPSIDLGITGVSFTTTGEVTLQNRSTVPVKFRLLIPDDVEKPAKVFNTFRFSNASTNESTSNSTSREFSVSPSQGLLEPQSSAKIVVEFTPTAARRRRQNNLTIEVAGSDGVQQILPIFFESKIPIFEIEPSGVNLGSCFINFPYTISFKIKNESDVDGFCYFPRQSYSERSGVFYSLSRSQWHVKPKETKEASITLITRSTGQQPMELCLLTRGGKSQKYFPIICEGQGPAISVQPTHLDFGDGKVLETVSKRLKIINDSPIPADLKVFLKDKTSPWRVSAPCKVVAPLKSIEIDVELRMKDPGHHSDKLILQILHRPAISVGLLALGTGSSIIFDPLIFPELSFGVLLTHQDNIREVMVQNKGTKIQKLFFSNNLDMKNIKNPPSSSTFFVEPFAIELDPDATQEIKVLARSEAPGNQQEHWWVCAMAEDQRRREILGESILSANFVVPTIRVTHKLLNFFINVAADEESCSEELTQIFEISNTSGLMLQVRISMSGRFRIVGENEVMVQMMDTMIDDDDIRLIKVCFVPEEEENTFLSKVYDGRVRIEHDGCSNGINIKCRASVNYPNLSLTPKELEFDAIFGSNCERQLVLRNEGPVPVHFNLSWDENYFDKRLIEAPPPSQEGEIDFGEENGVEGVEEQEQHEEVIEESINDLFTVVKTQGIIPPNSEEIVNFNFSANRPMNVETQLICEVLRGRTEVIHINARTDFVRYHLGPKMIDFGFQNILAEVDEILVFDNSSEINLPFKVICREDFEDAKGLLEIIPSEGIITRRSRIEFKVHYQCLIPGNFHEIFEIRIENSSRNTVTVQGCAIFPQIYIDLFHNWAEKNYPTANEYSALQSLNVFVKTKEDFSMELIRSHYRLTEDNWVIIYPNEFFPTHVDIDMRIEQFFAAEFIKKNRSFLISTVKVHKPGAIPYLQSAEYILDLPCLIAGQLIHRSLIIYNYSPQPISIRMKPQEKKNYLSRYGITMKFRDQKSLMPRDFCKLDITICPPGDSFTEKIQKIKRKIYLEVANGCRVPISILGTITSPLLKLNKTTLNFGDVIIGTCRVLNFEIQNNGIVDCKWRIIMYSEAQPTYFPFSLSDTSGTYSPGESGVISSYFKPTRGGSYKVEIIFEIDDGKRESLKLLGRGIEQKVRISESRIIFAPGVPGATRQEKEFSIKSLSKSPLEFAWQHLNEVGIVEERIMGVLIHYYGSKEILLPVRQLGAGLPKKIYEFYEELIGEMKSYFSINVGDELEDSTKLHNYIDILHQDSEFPKNMKDPVAAIFAELNSPTENPEVDKKVDVSNDMRSIIFYGAPFTKYQETACKTARKLDIPLLNLDSAMTEVIATGESPASSTVRQLINERYQELLTDAQKLIQDDDLISRRDTSERILNSDENDDYLKGNVDYTFFHPPDPLISFRKIPGPEDLEILDLLSQYEYKIEALSLLEKILGNSEEVMKGKLNVKGVEKMSKMIKTSQKNTLANIEVDSFADILKEVLMKEELKDGFVLQTLNNVFIEDHSPTFSKILESIPPESIAFINFHNSLETYQRKVSEKLNQIAKEEHEKLLLKLKVMDEMSLSEFEKLSEDDKNLFFEKIQRPRIEEARERREKFKKKISKPKVEEVLESSSFSTEDKQSLPLPVSAITENLGKSLKKKGQVTMKGKQSSADARNDQKEPKIGNIKANGQQQEKVENPRSDQAIAEAMELYNRNFNTIKSMIDDRSKTWVAAFADPWCPTSYDFIVDRIVESRPKKDIKSTETKKSIPQIAENIYSIYSYNKDKPFFPALPNEVPFQIGNIQEAPGGTMNARTILDAGEVKRFKVVFQPQEIGDFHQEFLLNVIGNHHKVYRISLSGIADIPRFTMDPKSIFTRIKETKIDEIHDPTFFVDTKTFDFGFLLTPEKHLKEARVHHKIAKFNFSNSSLINADVHYSLLNEHSKGFSLNKSSASVPPDENEVLTIIATAPQLGPNTDKLLIKIINNTQVEEIMLKSSGCQLNIEVQGKVLDFGRILLYRKDCRRVTLKNKTPIRVFWRILEIIDENGINPQISYSSSSGVIEPLNETHFDIYFHGQLVGTIVKETIRVGIFLFENDEESLLTEDINISAEVYDVSVDVNDANPIDLKTVKIGERTSEGFSLKNQGQYDINFVLQLEKFKKLPGLDKKLFKNFKDYLKINPLAGTLGRNKLTSINLDFIPKMEMKLKNLPIIKCNLFDTSKDATLIAEIPLTITITAQYSKFTIEPYPELFGGSIPILTHKNVYFTIRNVGIFPIEYKIDSNSFETTQDVEIIQILPPKLSKNPSKKKGKKSVIDVPSKSSTNISIPLESDDRPLNIGPFTLLQREGTIAVGQMTEITIDCNPQVEGKLTKNIFIKCSNCSAEDQNGRQLILTLDSCTPKINFDDFSSIFHHSYMAETVDDFTCTYDNAYSIFSKQDKTLHFEKVIVSSLYRVELKLYNPGLVPAEVKMTLRSEEIDEETNVFNIEPRRETIPPMTSRIFTVSFTPIRMCTYSCILEAAVVLPDHLKFQKLSVKLSGDGCIPEITFIEPNYLYKQGTISLNFGKCLLGQIQTKILVFKNTGKVKAKVIAEIIDDINSLYYLEVGDAGGDVHGVHRLKNNFVEIVSNSGDTSKILVLFEAREIGIFDSLVRIFLSDNPYEVTNINLKAEGFIEPVVIKGLTLVDKLKNNTIGNEDKLVVSTEKNGKSKKKKGSITQKMKKSSPGAEAGVEDPKAVTLAYELDAGICPFEEERVLGFEMVNTCEDKWFRFEFDSHNIFHFIPSVGHLNPLENKKIIMKFSIREPVVYERLPLNCFVDEIQLAEIGEQFFVSWDDQQTKTVVEEVPPSNSEESYEENCTTLKEINYPVREPRYELICKESEIIQLVVSAMAAWTTYYCPVEEINFDDTFILEKRNYTFKVTNPGIIKVIYTWKIMDHNHHFENYFEKQPNSDGSQNSLGLFAEFNNENKTEDSRTDASIEQDFPILSRCFKILPETGVIFPNETTEFRLTFSPEEKRQYNAILICEIACLNPQTRQLKIPISGKALLPHCHFDIPEFSDDYLKTVTNIENLLETMKIIEFRIIGVGGHHTKQFNLINPSDNSYKFSWKEKTLRIIVNGQEFPYFCCERTKGIATMREKTEMTFSFFAKDVGTFESLWEFCIDEFEVKVPFLLVGVVTEPRIICCPSRVQFKPTVIRTIVEESVVLTNYEDNSLDFSVVRNSLFSDGGLQRLFVEPMTGILVPKNGTLLTIKFKSAIVGNFDFSLGIQVEKMREPLCILIAARVCEVIPRLIYIGVHNETMELQSNYENTIDLGKMMIKKPIIVNFELWNMGELPFQYQWNLRMDSTIINKNMFEIKINAPEGEVQSTKTVRSCLSVVALKKMNLTNHRLTMKIINGPIFTVLLNASAKVPPVKFSFTQYDFGACYIRDQSQPYEVLLRISNEEENPALVEVKAENLQNFLINSDPLSQAISTRTPVSVPIYFLPAEEQKYEGHLIFIINSTITKRITVRGEGICPKVNLLRPTDKLIDLGHVPIGKETKRSLSIINSGKRPFKLHVNFRKHTHHEALNQRTPSIDDSIKIHPASVFTLSPNKTQEITIKFKPQRRMNSFEGIIGALIDFTFIPLSILRGKCLAPEFHLNRSTIQFDAITEGFTEEQKIVLHNSGDFTSKFQWNLSNLPHCFTIEPVEGISSPGGDVAFNIKFTADKKIRRFEGKGTMEIENYKKIIVSFIGNSKSLPKPTGTIKFTTPVRKEDQNYIKVENDLNIMEKIEITTFGNHFIADKSLNILPKSSQSITIKYLPLVMTSEGQFHEGIIIVKSLERKSVEIYKLKGVSSPPESQGTIVREIPAKKRHTELFSVENWSNKTQCFMASIQLTSPKRTEIFTFTGNNKIDVNAGGRRSYQAVFHCFNESELNFRVSFTNSESEYQFYEVEYKVTKPEILKRIDLTTTARTSTNHSLEIYNPLADRNINYSSAKWENSLDISIDGIPKILSPKSVDKITIRYLPMFPGESRELLEVFSEELGVFPYELNLKSLPAIPEKIVTVSTSLGDSKTFDILVKNSSRATAKFSIKIDEPFACKEDTIFIDSGEQKIVELIYEPSSVGRIERNVIAASETAGEIIYPIVGIASLPKAQGPFTITTKKALNIPFKNVFREPKTFQYRVDPPISFSTLVASNIIDSKQNTNVEVRFNGSSGLENDVKKSVGPITGRLVIYCTDPELYHINWVYYLNGVAS